MRRFAFILMLSALPVLATAEAQQSRNPPASPRAAPPAEPERRAPDPRHQSRMDQLFERLAASGTEIEANSIADQIARLWARSGSDTLDLLMERVQQAQQAQESEVALDILDSVLALKPDWAEAYSRRAAVHFQRKDMDAAMRDLRQTLVLEPRHFQALAGVGMIFQQNGNDRQALAAFREALKINPHFKGIKQASERLATDNDGQGI
jgi:tetratricopeptide (TPR) repeat protein